MRALQFAQRFTPWFVDAAALCQPALAAEVSEFRLAIGLQAVVVNMVW